MKLLTKAEIHVAGVQMFSYSARFRCKRNSSMSIGDRVVNDGRFSAVVDTDASLAIGSNVYFNDGAMLSAKDAITIGDCCLFGPNVLIFDNNHRFDQNGIQPGHSAESITIGDNCWIGAGVIVLKGTHIGNNCVVSAGCIVRGEIPDGSLVKNTAGITVVPIENRMQ